MGKTAVACAALVLLIGCSSSKTDKADKAGDAKIQNATHSSNPAMKYVELVGIRINEKGPGTLLVRFNVVNHSEADLGDLTLQVNIRANSAKPDDAPLCTFTSKVPSLGPEESKEVTATVPTKLRVYELPDWQFLKADFQIIEGK